MRRRAFAVFVTWCLVAWAIVGHTSSAAQRGRPDTPIDTLRVLDRAIHRLGEPSADYRATLQDALRTLPAGADEAVRSGVGAFLRRAPQPGPDFRCSRDFLRLRARYALRRLRDTLLNEAVRPVEPAVCYAAPFAIDVTGVRSKAVSVDVYGFDFDASPPQLVLVTGGGFQDVTSALVAQSHSHLTFKVGPGGVAVPPSGEALGLAWSHLILYSIPLVRPTTTFCSSRVETIPSGKTLSYSPPFVTGDPFSGPASAMANVELEYSSNKLEATLCVAAASPTLSGCAVEFLYTTDPDRVIEGVLGNVVRRQVLNGASVDARLGEIRVVSTDDRKCISAIAYQEARRTAVLSAETRRALDPQRKSIDPAILRTRPRFSPQSLR